MAASKVPDARLRHADAGSGWPGLAALLAPGAGCDCQMLAVTLAQGFAPLRPRERSAADR